MADVREPPPLFEDDLESKDLDIEDDDIFQNRKKVISNLDTPEEKHDTEKFEDITEEVLLNDPAAEEKSEVTKDQQQSKITEPEEDMFEAEEDMFEPEVSPVIQDASSKAASPDITPKPDTSLFAKAASPDITPKPAISLFPSDSSHEQNLKETLKETSKPVIQPHYDAPKMNVSESSTTSASASKTPFGFHSAVTKMEQSNTAKSEALVDESKYSIDITITDTKKVGDGMNAYMVYKVCTKTTIPDFQRSELEVFRRFSDFLGLRDKLAEKHLLHGIIIPAPPEKSLMGMAKIKVSKEESGSMEFVEQRRAALERFLNRVAQHPVLQIDPNFVDFLEVDGDLPKATNTSALSGAGVLRLFSRVGDSIGKMAFKMDETDQWFEEKTQQVETLDMQLRKLHSSLETLVNSRRDMAQSTGILAKSIACLGGSEEHSSLSRALSQLSEVEERMDRLYEEQVDNDFFIFAEFVKDYVAILQSVKEVFAERVKLYKAWKDNEVTLAKKREVKVRMELAHKLDKIQEASREISEWELHVEKSQQDFEKISKNIRKEMSRFEHQRCKDFRKIVIAYLESLLNHEQQVIRHWETFLPEAKLIV